MNKTFTIATETANGTVVTLQLPLMTYQQANAKAETLRKVQTFPIFVINTGAE